MVVVVVVVVVCVGEGTIFGFIILKTDIFLCDKKKVILCSMMHYLLNELVPTYHFETVW